LIHRFGSKPSAPNSDASTTTISEARRENARTPFGLHCPLSRLLGCLQGTKAWSCLQGFVRLSLEEVSSVFFWEN
jgi:hypothetical protein